MHLGNLPSALRKEVLSTIIEKEKLSRQQILKRRSRHVYPIKWGGYRIVVCDKRSFKFLYEFTVGK